jgi:hypothetical protein
MAEEEKLPDSIQLAVLAALCFDTGHGAAVAAQVRPEHFDSLWRDFAARVLQYRKKHGKPPGKTYSSDLAAQATLGRDPALFKKRLLPELFAAAEGLNAEYVVGRVQNFVRRQVLKGALLEAGARFAQDNDALVSDVEAIIYKALKFRQNAYDAGTFLNDPAALRFVDAREDFISLGIDALDHMRIGLVPKQLLLYIGPKGSGKSWFCVHCGKQALMQRQRVVHYTLEMGEEEVIPRYYQALFNVGQDSAKFNRSRLDFDDLDRLSGFHTEQVKARLDFGQADVRKILRKKMGAFGARFGTLIVKAFPTGFLTMAQLVGHLDYLEEVERFVPNVMIVDYPKLMHSSRENLRIDLGRNMEELRGIAVQRNLALVCPHQGTRATMGAKRTRSSDAGEDISVVQTADTVLAFSRTELEERLGLGRLSIEHARKSRAGLMLLLSQSYETGQYVLESAVMQKAYWERLRAAGGDSGEEE